MKECAYPDDVKKRIRELADEGYSASRIGAIVGKTRLAIIGFCYRSKIALKASLRRYARRTQFEINEHQDIDIQPTPIPHRNPSAERYFSFKPLPVVHKKPEPKPHESPPCKGTVKPIDALPHHCRWPVGDPRSPDFSYCGMPTDRHYVYCADHCRSAYQEYKPLSPSYYVR